MSKSLLYISCHTSLERNDLVIFSSLGFDVFSIGFYVDPCNPELSCLEPLSVTVNKEAAELFKHLNPDYKYNKTPKFNKEFLDMFDVIVVAAKFPYIQSNWGLLKGRNIIFQTVGQSCSSREKDLSQFRKQGLKVVRISETEKYFGNYGGHDDIIDLAINTDIYKPWSGHVKSMLTVNKAISRAGGVACRLDPYVSIFKNIPRRIYGMGNYPGAINTLPKHIASELLPIVHGEATHLGLLDLLSESRLFFSLGTIPAPTTLTFKEAMAAGCPVITWGPRIGNGVYKTFAAHTYIRNWENGFYSDDHKELREAAIKLLDDYDLAKKVSENAIKTANEHFSLNTAKGKWERLLQSLNIM